MSYIWLMDTPVKKNVSAVIRQARAAKGITQQALSDLTGISLRSVQRIENGEVVPRAYTIRLLAEKLGIDNNIIEEGLTLSISAASTRGPIPPQQVLPAAVSAAPVQSSKLNTARKIILSVGIALLMALGTIAFIAQSPRFPETAFETILLWMPIAFVYMLILYRLWK
jgi:transcriptional regulator with XRE-family HTH domain